MSALDAGIEVLLPIINGKDEKQALVAAKCLGLLTGYDARWREAPYRIDDVEVVMSSDLYNPESGRKSRSFTIAGKIDVRATEIGTGEKVIFDHKTTSEDISDPNSDYWRKLVVEGQVTHYFLLEWLNGEKVNKALWDVVRKPGISPKAVAKADAVYVRDTGRYFGRELSADDKGKFDVDQRETPMMYAARLVDDCSSARPEWYFQRRAVPRLDAEVRAYALDLWDHAQSILSMRQNDRYPRISSACMMYHSPCTYLALCSGHDTQDSGKWTKKDWVHPELPILNDGRGVEVLTNSRLQTLICPQKHHLKYEAGLEKLNEEEKEVLFFGSLWHEANERYFLELQSEQKKGS